MGEYFSGEKADLLYGQNCHEKHITATIFSEEILRTRPLINSDSHQKAFTDLWLNPEADNSGVCKP